MKDYLKILPNHIEKYIGENDLFLEIYEGKDNQDAVLKRPPDESADDIAFQRKYLAMESAKARNALFPFAENGGLSINGRLILCPSLVINAVNSDEDDKRGMATAKQLSAEYLGLRNKTHAGLLIGQRYMDAEERIIEWLERIIKRRAAEAQELRLNQTIPR